MPRFKQEKTQYQTPLERAIEAVNEEMEMEDFWSNSADIYVDSDPSDDGYMSKEDFDELQASYQTPEWQAWKKKDDEEYRQKRIEELTALFEAEDKKRLTKERLTLLKGKPKKGT